MNSLSRRSLVRAGAAGAFLPLAGCLFGRDESENGRESVLLCVARVENWNETSSYGVRMQLLDEDEIRFETFETVSPFRNGDWTVGITARDLDPPRGAFVFRVRVDDEEWNSYDLTRIPPNDAGVVGSIAKIVEDGKIRFWQPLADGYDCDHLSTEDDTVDNHD